MRGICGASHHDKPHTLISVPIEYDPGPVRLVIVAEPPLIAKSIDVSVVAEGYKELTLNVFVYSLTDFDIRKRNCDGNSDTIRQFIVSRDLRAVPSTSVRSQFEPADM